ncbi:anti-sigma factor [Pseudomonas phage PspYZU05]|uniref:Anti-sigma 70 protein n=1 Tax=Pseudomonas phage PspYZU05 TaxID=1983556 RepID=A0A2U7NLX5_9CAUD|nr:anti-sigma factor [Pseudomonas phage PspYZU05]ASD52138.1 anti-sigma 70 protein [Pseudomonas phage PspYZU05]
MNTNEHDLEQQVSLEKLDISFNKESIMDIIATMSILIKFDADDILDNINLFAEYLNELGFRTVEGFELNKYRLKRMFFNSGLSREDMTGLFDEHFERLNRKMTMYQYQA